MDRLKSTFKILSLTANWLLAKYLINDWMEFTETLRKESLDDLQVNVVVSPIQDGRHIQLTIGNTNVARIQF